jgi:hypothetical protein
MAISPTAEGFRTAFRRPSFTFAEVTWRWVVGATSIAVFFFGLFEYLDTLRVTSGEILFLKTRQPFLVWQAILHILRGNLSRGVLPAILAALMLAFLWMMAASVGRILTIRALLEHFRREPANDSVFASFDPVFRINFLRVSLVVAGLFGLAGAAILAGLASPDANPQPGVAFFIFVPIATVVCLICWALNWFLSLSALFAVRDGESAMGAIGATVCFCRERTGAVFAVSTWAALAHLVVFGAATTVVFLVLGFAGVLPGRLIALATIVVTVAYFLVADWLYMSRLSGYVCILETPEALMNPVPLSPLPPPASPPVQTTVDRDELILSDIPNPITG